MHTSLKLTIRSNCETHGFDLIHFIHLMYIDNQGFGKD
jgi:hypothetical protein